jgi:N-acetylglutamate synthase/N-acetylornithine aminotransferase
MRRSAPAIFGNIVGCIFRASAQIEAIINAGRYPALTGEKGMADAFEGAKAGMG